MTIEDFKQEIDGMFPCRWENDFIQNIRVTLEEFAGFLYIKAMQGIEKFWGYDFETVLNSMFCYKLPKKSTRL